MILRIAYAVVSWASKTIQKLEKRIHNKLKIVYTGWGRTGYIREHFESLDRKHVQEEVESFLQQHYPDNWQLSTNGFQYVRKGDDHAGSDVIGWVDDHPTESK